MSLSHAAAEVSLGQRGGGSGGLELRPKVTDAQLLWVVCSIKLRSTLSVAGAVNARVMRAARRN